MRTGLPDNAQPDLTNSGEASRAFAIPVGGTAAKMVHDTWRK